MLIIGHRGARDTYPENTIDSFRAGYELNIDIIELDVRLTKDNIPVLIHDNHLMRTHRQLQLVRNLTFVELQSRLKNHPAQIPSLAEVLKEFHGRILLNLELKDRHSARYTIELVQQYIKKKSDWDTFLFSSFKPSELTIIRKLAPEAHLALLERYNPFRFTIVDKRLNLTAVGFHRLHANTFTIELAKKLGLFTYAYTVNRPDTAWRLAQRGIDGIVTDHPKTMVEIFAKKTIE